MTRKNNVKIPLFPAYIDIVICDTQEELCSIQQDAENLEGFVCTVSNGKFRIGVLHNVNLGVVVHECEHLKSRILDFIGHACDYGSSELDAYMIEYLFNKVYDTIKIHQSKQL